MSNRYPAWLAGLALACAGAHAQAMLDADELAEAIRDPSIGLYRSYAEFKMARYPQARQLWEALAQKDVADAWFNLGTLAEDGLGESADMSRALALYQRGAELGSRKAQFRLGMLYLGTPRVDADPQRAQHWLTAAAQAGDAEAAAMLERLRSDAPADDYLHARQLETSGQAERAAALYEELALGGNAAALTRLAWLYEAGRGVPRDLARAAELFQSAAQAGEAEAQYALSVMLETGAGLPADAAAAMDWLEKSAAAGYPPAQEALAARAGR